MKDERDIRKQSCARTMRTHGDAVYRLAFARMRNKADAEDVLQTTFLRYFASEKEFTDVSHEKAWLLRVCINACIDLQRSAWRTKVSAMPENFDVADKAAALYGETPQERAVSKAMETLSPEQRTAVHLHYFEGYSTGEIAQMLGIRPATARSHLHRARIAMKKELERTTLAAQTKGGTASSKETEHAIDTANAPRSATLNAAFANVQRPKASKSPRPFFSNSKQSPDEGGMQ